MSDKLFGLPVVVADDAPKLAEGDIVLQQPSGPPINARPVKCSCGFAFAADLGPEEAAAILCPMCGGFAWSFPQPTPEESAWIAKATAWFRKRTAADEPITVEAKT